MITFESKVSSSISCLVHSQLKLCFSKNRSTVHKNTCAAYSEKRISYLSHNFIFKSLDILLRMYLMKDKVTWQ